MNDVVRKRFRVVNELGLSYVAAGAASSAYMAGHVTQFFFGDLADHVGPYPQVQAEEAGGLRVSRLPALL